MPRGNSDDSPSAGREVDDRQDRFTWNWWASFRPVPALDTWSLSEARQDGRLKATELAAAVAVTLLSSGLLLATSTGLWFFSDFWPIAVTDITTLDGLTRSHGGHWLLFPTLLTKACVYLFGEDAYPWYFLPRVVLYATLSFAWFVIMRMRSVRFPLAIASLIFIALLSTSGWIVTVVYTGPIIVGLCSLGAAVLIDRGECEDSWRAAAALIALVTIAVSSSADGPALLAACLIMSLWSNKPRMFLGLMVPAVAYLAWFLTVARQSSNQLTPRTPSVGFILTSPPKMAELIGQGVANTFSLAIPHLWPVLFVGFLIILLLLAVHRQLKRFDLVILITGLMIVALSVLVRGAQGLNVAAPNRLYLVSAYLVVGLFTPAFSQPFFRQRNTATLATALLLLFAFIGSGQLMSEIDKREVWTSADRPQVEMSLRVLDQGETYVSFAAITKQGTASTLHQLTTYGWGGVDHPDIEEDTEAIIKSVVASGGDRVTGTPLRITQDDSSPTLYDDGCVALKGQSALTVGVFGRGSLYLEASAGDSLTITREGDASFTTTYELTSGPMRVFYADPGEDGTTMTLTGTWNRGDSRRLCGFAKE